MGRIQSLVVGCVLASSVPLAAQRHEVAPRWNPERVLRLRETLELSPQQIEQLHAVRLAALERRTARLVAAMETRSRVAAGELSPDDARAFLADRRRAHGDTVASETDAPLNDILTEEQRTRLRSMDQRRGRAARGTHRKRLGRAMRGAERHHGFRDARRPRGWSRRARR